jgi:hypothetical protein
MIIANNEIKFPSKVFIIACFQNSNDSHNKVTIIRISDKIRRTDTRVNPKFPDWPPGARTANGTALCH